MVFVMMLECCLMFVSWLLRCFDRFWWILIDHNWIDVVKPTSLGSLVPTCFGLPTPKGWWLGAPKWSQDPGYAGSEQLGYRCLKPSQLQMTCGSLDSCGFLELPVDWMNFLIVFFFLWFLLDGNCWYSKSWEGQPRNNKPLSGTPQRRLASRDPRCGSFHSVRQQGPVSGVLNFLGLGGAKAADPTVPWEKVENQTICLDVFSLQNGFQMVIFINVQHVWLPDW